MKKRGLKLSDYNISNAKYNELKYFCMQYNENIEKYKKTRDKKFLESLSLIEETAKEADEQYYPYILKSVTDGIKYEYMQIPMGRRQFYEARRYFFYLLAKKR